MLIDSQFDVILFVVVILLRLFFYWSEGFALGVFLLGSDRTQVGGFLEVAGWGLVLLLASSSLQRLVYLNVVAEHWTACVSLWAVSECQELKIIGLDTVGIGEVDFFLIEFHLCICKYEISKSIQLFYSLTHIFYWKSLLFRLKSLKNA